jgi:DnaJ-class molecular chaperone
LWRAPAREGNRGAPVTIHYRASPMAAEDEQTAGTPLPCAPCRGTGRVVSNLGGEPSQVTCPWCEGSGEQLRGHDAQAARRASAS